MYEMTVMCRSCRCVTHYAGIGDSFCWDSRVFPLRGANLVALIREDKYLLRGTIVSTEKSTGVSCLDCRGETDGVWPGIVLLCICRCNSCGWTGNFVSGCRRGGSRGCPSGEYVVTVFRLAGMGDR